MNRVIYFYKTIVKFMFCGFPNDSYHTKLKNSGNIFPQNFGRMCGNFQNVKRIQFIGGDVFVYF